MKRILTGVALVVLLIGVSAMPLHARGWNNPNRDEMRQAGQFCWDVENFDNCLRYNSEFRCFEGQERCIEEGWGRFGGNSRCSENNQWQNNNGNRVRNGGGWRR